MKILLVLMLTMSCEQFKQCDMPIPTYANYKVTVSGYGTFYCEDGSKSGIFTKCSLTSFVTSKDTCVVDVPQTLFTGDRVVIIEELKK